VSWFGWVLMGVYVASTLVTISQIDKPNSRNTVNQAALVTLVNALIIIGIIYVGTGK
jgi:hypothetical protein